VRAGHGQAEVNACSISGQAAGRVVARRRPWGELPM